MLRSAVIFCSFAPVSWEKSVVEAGLSRTQWRDLSPSWLGPGVVGALDIVHSRPMRLKGGDVVAALTVIPAHTVWLVADADAFVLGPPLACAEERVR